VPTIQPLSSVERDYLSVFGITAVCVSRTGKVFTSENPRDASFVFWCKSTDARRDRQAADHSGGSCACGLLFTTATTNKRLRLCSLLGVAIELPEFPLSFGGGAIRRMGSFVLVVLAHSMQSPFCVGCFRSTGLRMEQLRELE
jgi:hypothetical protein